MKNLFISFAALLILLTLAFSARSPQEKPFGNKNDVEFADNLWKAINGYEDWLVQSEFYEGTEPHGKILKTYFSIVNIDEKTYPVIIKDNFGGKNATISSVSENPDEYLAAVTVMVKREEGYDKENQNWFWVKYKPDGKIDKNEKEMALAGRVAKGMDSGCIHCHSVAKGNDFFYSNDE